MSGTAAPLLPFKRRCACQDSWDEKAAAAADAAADGVSARLVTVQDHTLANTLRFFLNKK